MQFLDGRPGSSETPTVVCSPEEEQKRMRRALELYSDEFRLAHERPGEEIACEQRYTHWEVFLQLLGIPFTPKLGPPPTIAWTPDGGYVIWSGVAPVSGKEVA